MAEAVSEHGVCTVRVINYRRSSYHGSNIKIAPKHVSLTERVRFVQHDTDVMWTLRLVRISDFYMLFTSKTPTDISTGNFLNYHLWQ